MVTILYQHLEAFAARNLQYFLALSPSNRALAVLIVMIIVFTIASLVFALYAVRIHVRRSRIELRRSRLQQRWSDVLYSVLAGESRERLIQLVDTRDVLFFVDFLSQVARRLKGQEQKLVQEIAQPYLSRVAERTTDVEPERRARALKTLSVLGPDRYRFVIRDALKDKSPLVSMIAARAIVKTGDREDLELVVNRLEQFTTWSRNYLSALLVSSGKKGVPLLRDVLQDPLRSSAARTVAASALTLLNDLEAVPLAARVLEEEPDRDLHTAALKLIERLGDTRQADAVREVIRLDDEVIHAHALSALGTVGNESDAETMLNELGHPSPWVSLHAAQGLLHLGMSQELRQIAGGNDHRALIAQQVIEEGGEI